MPSAWMIWMIWRRLGAEDGNCMKTEACAHESTAGDGAKLEEIPRRCAPRNDKGWLRSSECPFSRVIPNGCEESAVGNTAGGGVKLEEIPRRCAPRNDRGTQAPRNAPFPAVIANALLAVIANALLPCHSERLTRVSFRTPYSRVIPNPLLQCHSERSEESAVGNSAGDGAKLEEIPRRCAPRNDKWWLRSSE
jgi:hypothetical protein